MHRRACFHSRLAHTAPACPSPSMPPPSWPVWRAQPAAPLTTAPLPGAPKERLAWHHAPRMMARTGCMVTRAARLLPKCAARLAPPCLLTSLPAELFVYGFQFNEPAAPTGAPACSRPGAPFIESIKALLSGDLELIVIAPDDGGLRERREWGVGSWECLEVGRSCPVQHPRCWQAWQICHRQRRRSA